MTHVVAIRILNECQGIVRDLIDELNALMIRSMIDAALENATTMTVSSNLNTVCGYCVVYKLEGISLTRDRASIPGN